jgi:hypothetical protein
MYVSCSISRAKTTVTLREPDNVSFNLPPSVPVPVAYQQVRFLIGRFSGNDDYVFILFLAEQVKITRKNI